MLAGDAHLQAHVAHHVDASKSVSDRMSAIAGGRGHRLPRKEIRRWRNNRVPPEKLDHPADG
jgi:hypothetical protein